MALFGRRRVRNDEDPESHDLARHHDLSGLRRWIADGGDPDATGPDGRTALHIAYTTADFAVVELLTELGADQYRLDRHGHAPHQLFAHLCRRPAYVLRVALADELRHVADHLEVTDGDGNTALHLAWVTGHQEAARRLVDHGASTTPRNGFGLTPSDMAMVPEYEDWLLELADCTTMPVSDHLALRQAPPDAVACALARVAAARTRPRTVLRCGIRLGIPATVDVLVRTLWQRGDKWIATDFLNSEQTSLESEAATRAHRHGFEIVRQSGGDTARWGSHAGGAPPQLMI